MIKGDGKAFPLLLYKEEEEPCRPSGGLYSQGTVFDSSDKSEVIAVAEKVILLLCFYFSSLCSDFPTWI